MLRVLSANNRRTANHQISEQGIHSGHLDSRKSSDTVALETFVCPQASDIYRAALERLREFLDREERYQASRFRCKIHLQSMDIRRRILRFCVKAIDRCNGDTRSCLSSELTYLEISESTLGCV